MSNRRRRREPVGGRAVDGLAGWVVVVVVVVLIPLFTFPVPCMKFVLFFFPFCCGVCA